MRPFVPWIATLLGLSGAGLLAFVVGPDALATRGGPEAAISGADRLGGSGPGAHPAAPPPSPSVFVGARPTDPQLLGGPEDPVPREFYFSRVAYSGWDRGFRGRTWAIDYPKADRQFLIVLQRLVAMDIYEMEHPVLLNDPGIRRFPFLYALEVGGMALTPQEVRGLRDYLLAGGFLVIDDFWGTWEWENFENEITRVLPEYPIIELSVDHPLFSTFYDITEIRQVPGLWRGRAGGPTWERDGYVPHVRGIFDEMGRLMVVINWNTDLGDAWEWAEDPYYPLKYSTYAYEMGVNMIVYAMSH